MSIKTLFAAVGLAVAAMGVSGAAEARDRWDDRRWEHNDQRRASEYRQDQGRRWDHQRRWDGQRQWSHDRRWKHDRRHYRQRANCWNEWHMGHRYRVCK